MNKKETEILRKALSEMERVEIKDDNSGFEVCLYLGGNGYETRYHFEDGNYCEDGEIWNTLNDLWFLFDMGESPYLCTENLTIALFEEKIEEYIPEDFGYIYSLDSIEEYLPEELYEEMEDMLNTEVDEIKSDFCKFEKELVAKVEKLMEEHELDLDTITVETCHSSAGMYFRLSIEDKDGNTYLSKSNFSDCENCAKISFITELLKENSNLFIKDTDWITNYDLRCLCVEDNETTTIEAEYGINWDEIPDLTNKGWKMFVMMCAGDMYAFPDAIIDCLVEELEKDEKIDKYVMQETEEDRRLYLVKTTNNRVLCLNHLC